MTQQYFTDDEWSILMKAPVQALSAVVLADKTDPVSFLKEVKAGVQVLMTEQERTDFSSDLGRSLMQGLKDRLATDPLQGEALMMKKMFEYLAEIEQLKSADDGRKAAIAHLKQTSSILASKVTIVQAQEFSNWLLGLARKVAEAVKEEGIFGIGGERVSRQEAATLSEIEKALSIK